MDVFELRRGCGPLILAFPHTGTHIPTDILAQLNAAGRAMRDTDWQIHRLYDGLMADATTVRALFHRYVIDANRDPAGTSLYPGQNTTGLVPLTDFDGAPIWKIEPSAGDVASRLRTCHAPYHAALLAEIVRVKALHGFAIVFDCHSIRSRIPFLFDSLLPDFNIGTDNSRTCDPVVEKAALAAAAAASGYTHVLNGRFKGGWTTRHYGRPQDNIHAIQLELAQSTHLTTETSPFAYDMAKAERLRVHLQTMLQDIVTSLSGQKT